MKYFFIAFIAISTLSFSQLASAQQQINNDGANAGELQPQTQNVQNNAGNQQDNVLNINNNVGSSDLLQNVKVNELNVTGAPAIGSTTKATNNLFSWLVLAFGIFIILLAPAIVYSRKIRPVSNNNDALPENTDNIQNIAKVAKVDKVGVKVTENKAVTYTNEIIPKDKNNNKEKSSKSSKPKKNKKAKKKFTKK
jgi:hypothetical protein